MIAKSKYPEADKFVIFTDLLGKERKGMYKKDVRAFVEVSESEMPMKTKLKYGLEEVKGWKYTEEDGIDMTRLAR
jgi:hypothetical protein